MDSLSVLQGLGQGHWIDDVAEQLRILFSEVVASQHSGALTLTLKVSPGPGDIAVVVEDAISRKPPKAEPRSSMYYAYEGDAYKRDPRQTVMEMREVPNGGTELRIPDEAEATFREA